jgi:hypothetical protein
MTNDTHIAITNQPTNSMEQNTSSEANKASGNQEFPHIIEPKGSLLYSQQPTT